MSAVYVHHRIDCAPLQWNTVAERLLSAGGEIYGIWRSQIGLPRDTITAITVWPNTPAAQDGAALFNNIEGVIRTETDIMAPTLRPKTSEPPRRQGNYAFRWFDTPEAHVPEFLELCEGAWPGFESAYDSQVIGLWRVEGGELDGSAGADELVRILLITRRPDLAMWERSKLPANEEEAEVRRKLSRRYDLCDWTLVYTTTLITADDEKDEARWA